VAVPGFFFGGAARLIRCGVYSHSPRLAPRRLTGWLTGWLTCR
jgi:hypothetical protein